MGFLFTCPAACLAEIQAGKWLFRALTISVKQFGSRHIVGPDLGSSCLQRLSADNTRRQRVYASHGAEVPTIAGRIFVTASMMEYCRLVPVKIYKLSVPCSYSIYI